VWSIVEKTRIVSNPILSRWTSGICRSIPWKDTGTLFGLLNVSWLSWFFNNESPYGLINLPTTYALDCLQGINTYICISIWYVLLTLWFCWFPDMVSLLPTMEDSWRYLKIVTLLWFRLDVKHDLFVHVFWPIKFQSFPTTGASYPYLVGLSH